MVTFYVFPIGEMDGAPVSFPLTFPNMATARLAYDRLVAGDNGLIPASERP